LGHRGASFSHVAFGVSLPQIHGVVEAVARRYVAAKGVVGRGLVGDGVGDVAALEESREGLGGVPEDADTERVTLAFCLFGTLEGRIQIAIRSSRKPVSRRRWMCSGSTSMQRATPSFMVIASGWAPPMPPRPAVRHTLPLRVPPKLCSARAAKVSYVPCKMPWVPM
jgi:hypothetical protein